jgi:hypothetical protein
LNLGKELRQARQSLPNLQRIAAKYPHDRGSIIGVHVRENPMPKRVISCVPIGLLATVIMLGTNYATLAADDCLAGPNRPPAQGGHWYYRIDHGNNRKCWYLVEPGTQTPVAQAPELQQPQSPPGAAPQPTFGSFFSSLAAGFPGSAPGAQGDPTTGAARLGPPARAAEPKNGQPGPTRQPRMALASKQHRAVHLRPPPEPTEEQPPASLNQADRDSLFEEFLRWKDRQ